MFCCFNRNIEHEYNYTNDELRLIENLKQKYGNLYNYSKLRYSKHLKLTIICNKHGEFKQYYKTLLYSNGCYKCSSEKNIDKVYNFYYT